MATMARTRKGVLGEARKKSGRLLRKHPSDRKLARSPIRFRSDMAQDYFPGTPPANRYEIADPAADDQPGRFLAMTEDAVPIEERSRQQATTPLARH